MLHLVHIRNLALIDQLEIEFTAGLNLVTGETGAGKSIIIGAIQLLLGQRADKSLIRSGADSCEVSGIFELRKKPDLLAQINERLDAAGLSPCEDGQLLVRRYFTASSGRAYVNASPTTLEVVRDLGDILVDVHGPYDHQSLLKTARQLQVLDAFGGLQAQRQSCADLYGELRAARLRIEEALAEGASPEMVEILRYQVNEIKKAKLKAGEDAELTARHAQVANASQLVDIITTCRETISDGDETVLDQIAMIRREIHALEKIDPERGAAFIDLLESAYNELIALADDLSDYGDKVDIDPREFQELESRIATLQRLKRKYGGSIETVLDHAKEAEQRLARLEDHDAYLETLRTAEKEAESKLSKAARKLSRERKACAKKLAPQITEKLQKLGFPDGEFDVILNESGLGATGCDAVEFHFAPNPGEGNAPLRAIASSGEISRVMLAVKTVLAAADEVPLLIFDEVDANIGGVVAGVVGEELNALGRERQVICISHLPQVAACGDRHFRVAKSVTDGRTIARLTQLSKNERVEEIARMLGDDGGEKVVRDHAKKLLKAGALVHG